MVLVAIIDDIGIVSRLGGLDRERHTALVMDFPIILIGMHETAMKPLEYPEEYCHYLCPGGCSKP